MQTLLYETRGPFLYMEFFSCGFIFSPTHTHLERDRDPVMLLLELQKVTLSILIVCGKQPLFLPTSKSCNLLSEYLYSQQAEQNRVSILVQSDPSWESAGLRQWGEMGTNCQRKLRTPSGTLLTPQQVRPPKWPPLYGGKLAVCCKRECMQKADHNKQFAFHNIQQQKTIWVSLFNHNNTIYLFLIFSSVVKTKMGKMGRGETFFSLGIEKKMEVVFFYFSPGLHASFFVLPLKQSCILLTFNIKYN